MKKDLLIKLRSIHPTSTLPVLVSLSACLLAGTQSCGIFEAGSLCIVAIYVGLLSALISDFSDNDNSYKNPSNQMSMIWILTIIVVCGVASMIPDSKKLEFNFVDFIILAFSTCSLFGILYSFALWKKIDKFSLFVAPALSSLGLFLLLKSLLNLP